MESNFTTRFLREDKSFNMYLHLKTFWFKIVKTYGSKCSVQEKPLLSQWMIISRTYNQHWLVQEAEQRRIAESRQNHSPASAPRQPISSVTPSPPNSSLSGHSPPVYENTAYNQKSVPHPQQQQQFQTQTQDLPQNQRHSQQEQHSHHQQQQPIYNNVDNSWKGQTIAPNTKKPGLISNTSNYNESLYANLGHNGPAPAMHSTHYPQRCVNRSTLIDYNI